MLRAATHETERGDYDFWLSRPQMNNWDAKVTRQVSQVTKFQAECIIFRWGSSAWEAAQIGKPPLPWGHIKSRKGLQGQTLREIPESES